MVMRKRWARIWRVAGVCVLLGAALHAWREHAAPSPPAAGPARSTRDPVPAAPAHWRLGRVDLHACTLPAPAGGGSPAAWCGQWPVAENPAHPEARTIRLRLAVIRSDAQTPAADMVTVLAGGPGQAATEAWSQLAAGLRGLTAHRNVLLLDQRGTGGSNPLTCHDDQSRSDSITQDDAALIRAEASQCAERLSRKADLRMYTTTLAIGDLEQVRQALGAPRLDLIGISYGTRVAQQYAGSYPAAVRSIVLDSVVPNALALGQDHAANLDAALQAQARRCESEPGCRRRFGDPYAELRQLQRQLQAHPQTLNLHDPQRYTVGQASLSADTLAIVARMFAYSPLTMAVLPLSVDAAIHGNAEPLTAQARLLQGRLSDSMSSGMGYAVSCSEDADLLHTRSADQHTLLGNRFVSTLQAICSVWPKGDRPPGFHRDFRSAAPVLLLSGEFDPVTPPRYARQVASGLPHARLLVLKGQAHNVILAGCTPRLVAHFIAQADVAAFDDSCLQGMQAPPFFTDFNGAAP